MRVKTEIDGRTKDVSITEVSPENYIVPSNEKHLYHCVIEVKKFDSETGKRLSVPRIQKFGKKTFENTVVNALKRQGYTITVLHNPNEYLKNEAKKEAQAKEEAEKKRYEAEKEKMRAEILKEIAEKNKSEETTEEKTKKGRKKNAETETSTEVENKAEEATAETDEETE